MQMLQLKLQGECQSEKPYRISSIMQGTVNAGLFCTSTMRPDFSKEDCNLLMALRSHSVRDIKANFSSIHKKNMSCPLVCDDSNIEENQIHLMSCSKLLSRLDSKYLQQVKDIKYSDTYGDIYIHSRKAAVRHLSILLDTRQTILEEIQTTHNIDDTHAG